VWDYFFLKNDVLMGRVWNKEIVKYEKAELRKKI
jgi:hypothetical protein